MLGSLVLDIENGKAHFLGYFSANAFLQCLPCQTKEYFVLLLFLNINTSVYTQTELILTPEST